LSNRDILEYSEGYGKNTEGLNLLLDHLNRLFGEEHAEYLNFFFQEEKVVFDKLVGLIEKISSFPDGNFLYSIEWVFFHCALIMRNMLWDYVNATDLYEQYSDGFQKLFSRICVINDVTGNVNWLSSRDAATKILEANFRERYDLIEDRSGNFYRKLTAINEGFVIARRIVAASTYWKDLSKV